MKILLIVPEYYPFAIGGGAEIYKNLAHGYQQAGHQVVVFYGYFPTKNINEKISIYNEDSIQFYQIPLLPTPRAFPFLKLRMPLSPAAIFTLKSLIKKEAPDVAHLHGYGFLSIDIMAFIVQSLNIPYLLTIHGWPISHQSTNFFLKKIVEGYLNIFSRQTLQKASKISCISSFLTSCLSENYQKKTTTIYNGFTVKNFNKVKKLINIRRKHRIGKDTKIILSLGRFAYIKGFQEMINLLPRIKNSGIKVKYLIAGTDEGYQNSLVKLIKSSKLESSVEFLNFLDDSQKKQYLLQSDYIAIPSLIEGFGLVALEAIACKKPILYGHSQAVAEVIQTYHKKVNIYDKNFITKFTIIPDLNNNFNFAKFDYNKIVKEYLQELKYVSQ